MSQMLFATAEFEALIPMVKSAGGGSLEPGVVCSAGLCVLGSGSGGNCSVLEVCFEDGRRTRLLIDIGLSPRSTCKHLEVLGIDIESIDGVLLTHLDADHCHGGWVKKLPGGAELFVHRKHADLAQEGGFGASRLLAFDGSFSTRGGVVVRPVLNEHDSRGSAAFRFVLGEVGDIGFATDLGRASEQLVAHMRGVDVLAIESNYCPRMQERSGRPIYLQRRIMGGRGHLSNGEALTAIRSIKPRRHVVLLHLSRKCNSPSLVAGMHRGAGYRVTITSQNRPSGWVNVGPSRGNLDG